MFIQGILNWLTLASLTFNSHKHEDEDPLKRLGNLTPYRVAPAPHKVEAELPGDCSVDRVMLLHRHGSRGPSGSEEVALINSLVQTLRNGHDALQDADLPENLRFLQTGKGYESHLVPENLTIIGREQLFSHGVEFGLKYPNFTTETLLSSTTQRVIDSMYFFAQGRFGREAEDKDLLTVANEWSNSYLPQITERLNDLLPYGVSLTDNNTHGALYACAYDLAAGYESPWCDVFYEGELADFEYELDLIMVASVGYLVPNNAGRVMGSVFVNKLIDRFSNTSGEAQSLYLEFGHDATIMAAMAAMDLNKDEPQLSPGELRPHRRFRTSYQTPFAAQMIWESFTCKESFDGPQIRLVLNEETYPLRTCAETKKDSRFGTCSLDAFTRANKFSTDIEFNDDTWQAACGARTNVYQSLNHQQSFGYLLH
ncbi:phosphoglycerate mutase-like protein [Suillus fuscotomentosus]|uniref:Phosphoglycerate mutase-like protein n=1 Tax=Suillus fuscotomentosus TaxID=1912939 RepID=A0AAD4EIV9_9AGAM|nr:phosphoglycerate mutase-like protein [Suillus fuscotomentosus]KAG1905809.1 phosphoglycerate mutase-like protein [Suillus fuscotomentosus]